MQLSFSADDLPNPDIRDKSPKLSRSVSVLTKHKIFGETQSMHAGNLGQARTTHPCCVDKQIKIIIRRQNRKSYFGSTKSRSLQGQHLKPVELSHEFKHNDLLKYTKPRLAPVLKTIFHQCVISNTCSQSNSDGSIFKQSHQS